MNYNGDGTFTISFKTGETLTYPEQSSLRMKPKEEQTNGVLLPDPSNPSAKYNSGCFDEVHPSVSLNVYSGLIYDDTHFNISDVMGAKFTAHKDNVAHGKLENCKDTTVDLAANDSSWYGDSATIEGGEGNEVILDEEDSASINGKTVKGQGTAAQKDYE